jgi:hypothetical protein
LVTAEQSPDGKPPGLFLLKAMAVEPAYPFKRSQFDGFVRFPLSPAVD